MVLWLGIGMMMLMKWFLWIFSLILVCWVMVKVVMKEGVLVLLWSGVFE